jgi:L-ascorbate metabolism protein UlaG (beta-lactamase superfamily)
MAGQVRGVSAFLMLVALAGCLDSQHTPPSRIYYTGPVSSHFDGQRFFNPDGEQGTGGSQRDTASDFVAIAEGRRGDHGWPKSLPVTRTVPPRRVEGEQMHVTWIGHATTLVQTQGLNILIDPVWAWRDSPIQFVGPKRVRPPGVSLRKLPPIDLVLISHNHYDHLDMPALRYVAQRDDPLIITGLGNDKLLAEHGIRAIARDWGDRVNVRPGIDVILTRAHHWSARWIDDRDRALWTGFRVTLPGGDLYYSGDTGPGDMHWATEAKAASPAPIRFALLPIAPYQSGPLQTGNHIDPEQAVTAFEQLRASYALGVHWGTFELGPEPIGDAPIRLRSSLQAQHVDPGRFRTLDAGQSWDVPAVSQE